MVFITSNYSENKKNDFSPLPAGEYETTIESAQHNAANSGTEYMQIKLRVRKDLDGVSELANTNGKQHNRVIFMKVWASKQTGEFKPANLQYILDAAAIPEGTEINTIEDFLNMITNKNVRAYVKVKKDDNGVEQNEVAAWNLSKTKYPTDPLANSETVEVQDSDLPF